MIPDSLIPVFRESLISGAYNLLLGAGISLDSSDSANRSLPSGETLRTHLCHVTGAKPNTSLSRVTQLLSPEQVEQLLVNRFAPCTPGPTVARLSNYVWRRLLTFNIDDVIEQHYERARHPKQELRALNYDAGFEPTPERRVLQAVHMHGWARQPEKGFVFTHQEYSRVMRGLNPWMHMLAEILATESFLIAGATLNEPDLEYYLSFRTSETPRRGTGPSLLIEPFPDVSTRADCERFGLILVEAKFGDFLEWVAQLIPTPPTVSDLVVPDVSAVFHDQIDKRDLLRFFSDFELVRAGDQPLPAVPSSFLYGREPDWQDLDGHIDILRSDYERVSAQVNFDQDTPARVVVLDDAGSGKTTVIKRVAHSKARSGQIVFNLRTVDGINVHAARSCLSTLQVPVLLVVDNIGAYATQVQELLEDEEIASRVGILGAERAYRREFVELILGQREISFTTLSPMTSIEYRQLIERFRRYGLLGASQAITAPEQFARRLQGDVPTVAVCRILNDFRPLDAIVDSLWAASDPELRSVYLTVVLAQHCHWPGLRYSIAQRLVGPRGSVSRLFDPGTPLRLVESTHEADFLVALNWAIAERVLQRVADLAPDLMFTCFSDLAAAIAPYVNRRAIIARSAEAKLAGRLFDADKIVKPLLGQRASEFYAAVKNAWEWNSRYWEQRALLTSDTDLTTALRYARHGLSVERHPFPLTTLAKILFQLMESDTTERDRAFGEGFQYLSEAIESEAKRSRFSVHPFMTLLTGAVRFVEMGGAFTESQWQAVVRYAAEAEQRFSRDPQIQGTLRRLDLVLEQG